MPAHYCIPQDQHSARHKFRGEKVLIQKKEKKKSAQTVYYLEHGGKAETSTEKFYQHCRIPEKKSLVFNYKATLRFSEKTFTKELQKIK